MLLLQRSRILTGSSGTIVSRLKNEIVVFFYGELIEKHYRRIMRTNSANSVKECGRCCKTNHTTEQCHAYLCTHCDSVGHTKSRCPDLLKCGKCEQQTHATDECTSKYCEYCDFLKKSGENPHATPLGHTRKQCRNLMTCEYCRKTGHTRQECFERKRKEEECTQCKKAWHQGICKKPAPAVESCQSEGIRFIEFTRLPTPQDWRMYQVVHPSATEEDFKHHWIKEYGK